MSEQEIADAIKLKVLELNELIKKSGEQNLTVRINQSRTIGSVDTVMAEQLSVNVFKLINY
jgi:hypothetical protein